MVLVETKLAKIEEDEAEDEDESYSDKVVSCSDELPSEWESPLKPHSGRNPAQTLLLPGEEEKEEVSYGEQGSDESE